MELFFANVRIFAMVCVALYVAHTLSNYAFDIKHALIAFGLIVCSIVIYSILMVICDAIFPNKE